MSPGAMLYQVERQHKEFPLGSCGPPPPPESAALGLWSHQSHGEGECTWCGRVAAGEGALGDHVTPTLSLSVFIGWKITTTPLENAEPVSTS